MAVDPLDALAGAAAAAALTAFAATFGHGLRHPKQLLKRAQAEAALRAEAEAALRGLRDIDWAYFGRAPSNWELLAATEERPLESPERKTLLNDAYTWTRTILDVATHAVRRLTAATDGASWTTPDFRAALHEFHHSVEDLQRALGEKPEAAEATRIIAAMASLKTRYHELWKTGGAILDLRHANE